MHELEVGGRLGLVSRLVLVSLVLAVFIAGCEESPQGDKGMGETCTDARECRRGYCVAGPSGDQATCTRSCASTDECPRGWSCSGVTADNVVVCVEGAANPFGIGARE